MQTVRFLDKSEYADTLPLFLEAFGSDDDFIAEYYGMPEPDARGAVSSGLVAVLELDGVIVSMAHALPCRFRYTASLPESETAWYILCVATSELHRHRGFMDKVMSFLMESLRAGGESQCFLVPVNKEIYRHLGFVHDWNITSAEADLLYADDGLFTASAALLNKVSFRRPDIIEPL